jgi:hypothetical protein
LGTAFFFDLKASSQESKNGDEGNQRLSQTSSVEALVFSINNLDFAGNSNEASNELLSVIEELRNLGAFLNSEFLILAWVISLVGEGLANRDGGVETSSRDEVSSLRGASSASQEDDVLGAFRAWFALGLNGRDGDRASILEEMIQDANGSYTQPSEIPNPTLFHAKKQAPISIKDYLRRFAKFSNCHYDAFVYALIYLDKVSNNIENFSLDSFNVYRLVLMCLVSSIKFYDDAYYTNKYYAQMGGVNVEEFNKLEQEFLINYIQFGLYVDVETYSSYYDDLLNYHHKLAQEDSL